MNEEGFKRYIKTEDNGDGTVSMEVSLEPGVVFFGIAPIDFDSLMKQSSFVAEESSAAKSLAESVILIPDDTVDL